MASQLGHASPELTLSVYAHALREEESDLTFPNFHGTKRHPCGTKATKPSIVKRPPSVNMRNGLRKMMTGARFERATDLGSNRAPAERPVWLWHGLRTMPSSRLMTPALLLNARGLALHVGCAHGPNHELLADRSQFAPSSEAVREIV